MTSAEVAKRLGVSPQTIRNWRRAGKGPPFHGSPPRVFRYPKRAFEAWYKKHWLQAN